MKQLVMSMLIALFIPASATMALAADEKKPGPCKEDRAKFCADVKPGGGAVPKCLAEHDADLSAACKAAMEKRKQKKATGQTAAPSGGSPSTTTPPASGDSGATKSQ